MPSSTNTLTHVLFKYISAGRVIGAEIHFGINRTEDDPKSDSCAKANGNCQDANQPDKYLDPGFHKREFIEQLLANH